MDSSPVQTVPTEEQIAPLLTQSKSLREQALAIAIVDKPSHQAALELMLRLKRSKKAIIEFWSDPLGKLNELRNSMLSRKRAMLDVVEPPLFDLETRAGAWEREQLRLEAVQRAEAEEVARKQGEEASLAQATAAQNAGDMKLAEEFLEDPDPSPPAAPVPTQVASVSGLSRRKIYKAKVVDFGKAVDFIAANHQYLNLLDIKVSALNALARAQGTALKIPGVVVEEQTSYAGRG